MSLQPGDTLLNGQYRIARLLGRGGFGFVYLAEDALLHQPVAIKELIPTLIGDEAMLKRFLAEARATLQLTHERIVRTYSLFSERGNYYIAMEYMAGGSLEARLGGGRALPVADAIGAAADVAEGLAYAHGHGVVHCDLKPANILFTGEGRAKVADFGIAHMSDQILSRSWATATGFVAGTLPYMSPEQMEGVRDDLRVDVYALAAVLYRALTGRPYLDFEQGETPAAQVRNGRRIQEEAPTPPSRHNGRVPGWLDAIVLRALAKRPAERYASAGQMREALLQGGAAPDSALAMSTHTSSPHRVGADVVGADVVGADGRPPLQPQWLWPAIGGTAALLVVVVIALAAGAGGGGAGGGGGRARATPRQSAGAPTAITPGATFGALATTATPPTATAPPPTAAPTAAATPLPSPTPMPSSTQTPAPTPTTAPTATPAPKPAFTVREGTVNVRAGPGVVYAVVGALRQGETYEITGKNAAGDWWQFAYQGQPAWISGQVVQAADEANGVAVVAAPPTPAATPTSALGIGATQVSPVDGMTLVYVPAGEFTMGSGDSDSDAASDEKPQHKVTLSAFWIDRTEVTQGQYQQCVAAGKCAAPGCGGTGPGNHPVVCVSWQDAAAYCAWAGRRLPTEAEWEKAARGTDGRKYPWGNEAPDDRRLNYNNNVGATTAAGSYGAGASPYGALDMAGNVWEWVADWYDERYYAGSPAQNPAGPASGQSRVLRGGSWFYGQSLVRVAARARLAPVFRVANNGFRCARF